MKKNYTILFVEDEEEIRKNYVHFLANYFLHIYEASDGEKAYEIYKNKKPDILIIDINIPKLNGLDLLKKIREKDHSAKAIVLTAHSDVEYLLKATELKLTKYLVKPISRGELKEALHVAVEELENYDIKANKFLILKENYKWNCFSCQLTCGYTDVILTKKEQKVLEILFQNRGKLLTYDFIITEVWDESESLKLDSLKTIIKQLRAKLPKNSIENIFGQGYQIK